MMLRLDQASVNGFKHAMTQFLPHYVNFDLDLPTEYHYSIGFLSDYLAAHVTWDDITYSQADLDIADVRLDLTRSYNTPLIKVDFPAIKNWVISANQRVGLALWSTESPVRLVFSDFDFDFNCNLRLGKDGNLQPVVYDVDIKFGNSYLYHDNWFVAFAMHQFVYFAIVILEQSVYFVGEYVFTNMLAPVIDTFLNHYKAQFYAWTPVAGQYAYSVFELDYRNTQTPYIGDGFANFYYSGEVLYNGTGCPGMEHEYMVFSDKSELGSFS